MCGAQARGRAARGVDLDVHQGDGTATLFEGDGSVFTLSMHCGANFHFRKARSDLDTDVTSGSGAREQRELAESSREQPRAAGSSREQPRSAASRPRHVHDTSTTRHRRYVSMLSRFGPVVLPGEV